MRTPCSERLRGACVHKRVQEDERYTLIMIDTIPCSASFNRKLSYALYAFRVHYLLERAQDAQNRARESMSCPT
jgi:hypothetical protein